MGDTAISWTDKTWNPIRGCSRVSEGCRNCYAEQQAARIVRMGKGAPTAYDGLVKTTAAGEPRWTGEVILVVDHLADPLRWKKPQRVFVNSMSDLFHEGLADEDIDRVFAVMLLSPRHTFQVLTKRAARMRAYMTDPNRYERVLRAAGELRAERPELNLVAIDNPTTCPKPWIWLGVSVENQAAADERIPELLRTPAAVRFLSCEPLLGPVDLDHVRHQLAPNSFETGTVLEGDDGFGLSAARSRIDWVIAGCESGPGSRPCSVEWLRSLRDQCAAARVPFFLKQARHLVEPGNYFKVGENLVDAIASAGPGTKRKPGGVIELPYLDGVQHAAFPVTA